MFTFLCYTIPEIIHSNLKPFTFLKNCFTEVKNILKFYFFSFIIEMMRETS